MLQMLLPSSGPDARQHVRRRFDGRVPGALSHCFCWLLAFRGTAVLAADTKCCRCCSRAWVK